MSVPLPKKQIEMIAAAQEQGRAEPERGAQVGLLDQEKMSRSKIICLSFLYAQELGCQLSVLTCFSVSKISQNEKRRRALVKTSSSNLFLQIVALSFTSGRKLAIVLKIFTFQQLYLIRKGTCENLKLTNFFSFHFQVSF